MASSMFLTGLQATINAPRDAFRACLRQANTKAQSQKVGAEAYEAFIRTACTVEHDTLKTAIVAFNMKNGMARKAAADDAEFTISDYVGSMVDNYKFMADFNKPAPAPAAAPATPAATPAAAAQPPK
jgi:hypothetical protein